MSEEHFNAMLSLDDPDFAQKFLEVIGAKPGDTVEISTPQFNRTDGVTPGEQT